MQLSDYVGNPSAYAVQQEDGSYRPVREALTDDVLQQHIRGELTIGTYLMDKDKARSIVFDEDTGDLGMTQALAHACKQKGLSAGVEFSGRKGYHVWVLFEQWESAAELRRLARSIANEAGFMGEVFPKQDAARDLGNLVKLPFGKHQVTGQRSRFVGPPPRLNAHGVFVQVLGGATVLHPSVPRDQDLPMEFPCFVSIQVDPPREGERNILTFHAACHLRRMGVQDEMLRAALATVVDPSALDPGEFDGIIENTKFSGPLCDQLAPNRHCPEDSCLKTRSKLRGSQRAGQLRHAALGEAISMVVTGHTGGVVEMSHPDASMAKAALKRMED